jgi:hypothetical protein
MYATLQDMRDEGVTLEEARDGRVIAALLEATEAIDKACGWFFEPRDLGFALSGRDSPILELPVPPIRVNNVRVGTQECTAEEFAKVGAPVVGPQFYAPKLIRRSGFFPKGTDNVWVFGRWGYTVPSATNSDGATPLEIRRAALMLARRYLPTLGSDEAVQRSTHWRVVEERTRDQSYRLEARGDGPLTGDPEVDAILLAYRRPMGLGAA